MSYIGSTPTTQSFIEGTDYFNGDGSTTAFTLSRSVVSVNDIQATINNVVQQPNTAYTVSGTTITFTSAPSAGTSNIYVRYLSTTTQSITPSQNTVSYSTLNSDNQSKLGISFKNRIINGAMVIDQRNNGTSLTVNTGTTGYSLDRYGYNNQSGANSTIQRSATAPAGFQNSLLITMTSANSPSAAQYARVFQGIEGYNMADLAWGTADAKTITLSFWVRSSVTGTHSMVINNGAGNYAYPFTYSINTANTWEQKSVTVPGATGGSWGTNTDAFCYLTIPYGSGSSTTATANVWASAGNFVNAATGAVNLCATNGATFYLTGLQIEVGTQATTFDYRSIGTEFALCQRYFQAPVNRQSSQSLGLGQATSTTAAQIYARLPVEMRAAPSVSWSGGTSGEFIALNTTGGFAGNVSNIVSGVSTTSIMRFDITASGMTSGTCTNVQSGGPGTSWVFISAEL